MSRIIKYRGKRINRKEWIYGFYSSGEQGGILKHFIADNYWGVHYEVVPETAGQFTGHQIKGVDLYEDDVVRVEENGEGVDPMDKMTWYVVTWIKEWCMFALLRVEDEYPEYKNEGTDGLDTTMFWTFPLDVEDIGPSQHYLCGNIHQHPELLTPSHLKGG